MALYGPVQLSSHTSTDEDYDHLVEAMVAIGIPEKDAVEFITANPLYEVTYDFYLDLDTGTAYCTGVDLGDGEPFERPCPGQQLNLFP